MSRAILVFVAIFVFLAIVLYSIYTHIVSLPIEPTYYFVNAEPIVKVIGPETTYIEAK